MVRDLCAHFGCGWGLSEAVLIGALCEWHPDGDEYAGWWE